MRVLVTGCGGFLGTEIVRQLLARGDEVVGFGRSEYPQLSEIGMYRVRGDIRVRTDLESAFDNIDGVVHTAAIAGVWGPKKKYHDINFVGTQHVIDLCREHNVRNLVFSSSPSVTFGGNDQSGVDESEPYPSKFLCHYPRTKAAAEQAVLAASGVDSLATCALRPHLIWSEDDPHLFRRVIERAKSGRLVRVGSGENLIDTIHVRNAAHAHLLALDKLKSGDNRVAGRPFFLSQGEPIPCWNWISRILSVAGIDTPTKSISYRAAYAIGAALEIGYRASGRQSEPPMTRFVAAQLAKDHYFDIRAARECLGYEPIISTADGMRQVESVWR